MNPAELTTLIRPFGFQLPEVNITTELSPGSGKPMHNKMATKIKMVFL